jgi:hypothetical protein
MTLNRILSQLTRDLGAVPSLTCDVAQARLLRALGEAAATVQQPMMPTTLCDAVAEARRDIVRCWASCGDVHQTRAQQALDSALTTLAHRARDYGADGGRRAVGLQLHEMLQEKLLRAARETV